MERAHPPSELQGGNADRFLVRLRQIRLHSGATVDVAPVGVTAIVGANNVGKSSLLSHTVQQLGLNQGQKAPGWRMVDRVDLAVEGEDEDFVAWLSKSAVYVSEGFSHGFISQFSTQIHSFDDLVRAWQNQVHNGSLGLLHQFLITQLTAFEWLSQVQPAGTRDGLENPPTHLLHFLQDDLDLLRRLREFYGRVFRERLTLDALSGHIRLRVGEPTVPPPPVDAVTAEYRNAMVELPNVGDQGDGVKSLVGILLPLLVRTTPMVFIDEPEAFLHPPQAVALGRIIGELAQERELQVVLATHDRNLLAGLLQAEGTNISVVRLERQGNNTSAYQLDSDELRRVWSDPILRYSNVLDGLFHRLVVLAEGDRDCRFFAAALEYATSVDSSLLPSGDVLFVPSSGKASLPKFAKALHAVRVPVVASPDLDILNDDQQVKALVESFGGDWSHLERDYRVATNVFRQPRPVRKVSEVLTLVTDVLKYKTEALYTADIKRLVSSVLSVASPFEALKTAGMTAFGNGESRAAATTLLDALDAMGIVPARVGELESFAPLVNVRKGPEWLQAAFAAEAHKNPETQEHVKKLVSVHASVLR